MKKQRLKLISVTVIVFVVALGVAVVFVREINQQSQLLQMQVTALQKDQAQQTQLAKLKKLVGETAGERTTLNSLYLESQSDSIDFLNYVEVLALEKTIDLETISATEAERGKKQLLEVRYKIGGTRAQVEQFVVLLETIPYVSELTSVQLTTRSAVQWEASVIMEVTVLEHHESNS